MQAQLSCPDCALGLLLLPLVLAAACSPAAGAAGDDPPPGEAPPGMVWVPGGEFTMGWEGPEARPDEGPSHRVRVDGFWMDATEVTNAQFRTFVEATGYETVAERPVDWEVLKQQVPPGTPKPPDEMLAPGSLVFTPPDHAVDVRGHGSFMQWWSWVPGASWRHPLGPQSSIEGMDDYPVVHVSFEDAQAYAAWAEKSLPTEAQWERAARYGHDGAPLAWGEDLVPEGEHRANIWQGEFPHANAGSDGFVGIAPVKRFAPTELGLYDLVGNVWEWTADQYDHRAYAERVAELDADACCINPEGPELTRDQRNPLSKDSRVQKGGSFLCHASYCSSYRPSAKMGTTSDSAMNHTGFRCVLEP